MTNILNNKASKEFVSTCFDTQLVWGFIKNVIPVIVGVIALQMELLNVFFAILLEIFQETTAMLFKLCSTNTQLFEFW
jgi:hypothetical protein